jgi:Fe-S oxidoreductase
MEDQKWKSLEDYRAQVWGCARCNWCQNMFGWNVQSARFSEICPAFYDKRLAPYSGMGKMHISRALLEEEFGYEDSPQLVDIAYRCTLCGACMMNCQRIQEKEPAKVTEALRAELVERAMVLPEHKAFLKSTAKYYNPFDVPKKERLRWTSDLDFAIKDLNKEKAKVLFYVGCMYGLESKLVETTKVFARILHAAGVDFGILGIEEKCCGMEQYKIGERGLFEMLAEENLEMINRLGIDTLVTSCPHCYRAFETHYPALGKMNFEAMHFTQYLKRLITVGKVKLKELPRQTVTYNDPCNLGRWCGEYAAPREVLESIKGIELREMERNCDQAWCCGAGGGVLTAFPDFATSTAEVRVAEAEATGASVMATACPFCEYNLVNATELLHSRMEVLDIAQIVLKSMTEGK